MDDVRDQTDLRRSLSLRFPQFDRATLLPTPIARSSTRWNHRPLPLVSSRLCNPCKGIADSRASCCHCTRVWTNVLSEDALQSACNGA